MAPSKPCHPRGSEKPSTFRQVEGQQFQFWSLRIVADCPDAHRSPGLHLLHITFTLQPSSDVSVQLLAHHKSSCATGNCKEGLTLWGESERRWDLNRDVLYRHRSRNEGGGREERFPGISTVSFLSFPPLLHPVCVLMIRKWPHWRKKWADYIRCPPSFQLYCSFHPCLSRLAHKLCKHIKVFLPRLVRWISLSMLKTGMECQGQEHDAMEEQRLWGLGLNPIHHLLAESPWEIRNLLVLYCPDYKMGMASTGWVCGLNESHTHRTLGTGFVQTKH